MFSLWEEIWTSSNSPWLPESLWAPVYKQVSSCLVCWCISASGKFSPGPSSAGLRTQPAAACPSLASLGGPAARKMFPGQESQRKRLVQQDTGEGGGLMIWISPMKTCWPWGCEPALCLMTDHSRGQSWRFICKISPGHGNSSALNITEVSKSL